MRIEKTTGKQPLTFLFLNRFEENQRLYNQQTILEIIQLGYPYLSLENLDFTRSGGAYTRHPFSLIPNLSSSSYQVRNVKNIDVAIQQKDIASLLEQILNLSDIVGVAVKDRYLPFRFCDKIPISSPDWKTSFRVLQNFDWNLYFNINERSYFASPDETIIARILEVLELQLPV